MQYIFDTGFGAFFVMVMLQLPYFLFFLFIIFFKNKPSGENNNKKSLTNVERLWVSAVAVIFIAINVASISYFPTVVSENTAQSKSEIIDVNVTAESWSYEISQKEFKVGQSVRFLAKSLDTVHGFAIYNPNGNIVFTLMLIPGVNDASLIFTFKDAGTYAVRCLEFCGLAHHNMNDELVVVQAEARTMSTDTQAN